MYRHLMKAKKLYVYVVVFVAFVNACFFMPMQVQASGNFTTTYYLADASTTGTAYFPDSTGHNSGIKLAQESYTPSTSSDISYYQWFTVVINSDNFDDGDYFVFDTTLVFASTTNVKLTLVSLWPTFKVCEPTYSTDNNSDQLDYNNYDITFSSTSHRESDDRVEYSIRVSGNYKAIYKLVFTFRLRFDLEPYSSISSWSIHWRPVSESLSISGSESSVSQNVQDLVDGYNDSAGNQAASDLGNSASGYEQAEDNLFQGSESSLSGFEFFDFSGFTGITTGLSFVSSMLVSIYNNFGGMSGIGIVISVLFSVMFLAIVIGLYRYFK